MNIEQIFANRPVEPDTTILDTAYAHYDDIPVMIERWYWKGITAASCVIPREHLEAANMEREAFVDILKDKLAIEGEVTLSENKGFIFMNFNFES